MPCRKAIRRTIESKRKGSPGGLFVQTQEQQRPRVIEEMNRESRKSRAYGVSPLPTLRDGVRVPPEKDVLMALYGEICSSWHVLIDLRFKLLGFVPSVSVALIASLLSNQGPSQGLSRITKTGIAVLGLIATLALLLYDLRNSELHDDLISRARKIEDELGVDTGQFRGRLKSSNWFVKHDRATALIYGAALSAWAFSILVIWMKI